MTDSDNTASFDDVIDEETLERVRRQHGDMADDPRAFLPFKGQTYRQLVYALVGGIPVTVITYIGLAYLFGVHDSVFSGEAISAVHDRRHLATLTAFTCGLYYTFMTVKAYGCPIFNHVLGIIISGLSPYLLHIGPWTPPVTTGVFSTGDFSFHPSLVMSALYIGIGYLIPIIIVKLYVEIWIRLDQNNLSRAIEWEESYMPYPIFSERRLAKNLNRNNGSENK